MRIDRHSSLAALAEHLRSLRTDRKWTLQDLALRSGVSRATLSRIEKGEVSPTAETLGRLASAYALPISRVIAPLDDVFEPHVSADRQQVWQDPDTGFVRRVVSPRSGPLSFEIIEGTLPPSAVIVYDRPAIPGQEHHLVLLSGDLTLQVEDDIHRMQPLDCLRYALRGPSRFRAGASGARYILAIR